MATNPVTIGLDLGDRRHAACVLAADGAIIAEELIVNARECLEAFSQRFPGAVIAMETGTHSPWISRLFQARGHRVVVANARRVRAITTSNTKSDVEDARMLAQLCRADERLLSPVRHRSEACQRALLHIKVREALVRSRVNLTNTVRFLLKSLGLQLPASVKAMSFTRKTRASLDDATRVIVEPLLESLDALNARIKQLDERLETMATEEYPAAARLQQIPGQAPRPLHGAEVGPITALCFVLTLETPERFARARDVGAYLGLVPRRDQSGERDKQLRITKAGSTHLRCLLVNCAHYIMGPFGPPSDLREAGMRLAARGGSIAKKRAVIAVARKLAVVLMTLWKTGADYQPTMLKAA
jgi:transposase